jgi:predicted DNA-binding antitoxin AbrB/MazE fold protein
MKAQIYDAVFENGIFRPLTPPDAEIDDGQQVRLVVEPASKTDVLQLATHVYDGLSEEEIDSIEQIALDRRDFFEDNR